MARGDAIKAGDAFVRMSLRDDDLQKGIRRVRARLDRLGDTAGRFGRGALAIGGGIGAALGGAATLFGAVGDRLEKLSTRTGVGVQALSELGFAAERSGTSIQGLANGLLRMQRRLGRISAGEGTSTQTEAVQALGLDQAQIQANSTLENFLTLADAMASMESRAEAAGLAQRAFGTEVDKLLPLLLAGRDGIAALRQQARDLGITMDDQTASQAARLTDSFTNLTSQLRQVGIAIGSTLAPALIRVYEAMQPVVSDVIRFAENNKALVGTLVGVSAALVGLGAIGLTIQGITALTSISLAGLGTAIAFVQTTLVPLLPLIFSIGVGIALAIGLLGGFRDALGGLLDTITDALGLSEMRQAQDRLSETNRAIRDTQANLDGIASQSSGAFDSQGVGGIDLRKIRRTGLPGVQEGRDLINITRDIRTELARLSQKIETS